LNKKVIVFDLDDTLAASKSSITDEMSNLLGKLLEIYSVAVISGGKFQQFENQLIANLNVDTKKLEKLHLLPTCGTRYYTFRADDESWKMNYAEDFTDEEKKKIIETLETSAKELGLWEDKTWGDIIEDRESQITYSALGQEIVQQLGEEGLQRKENWDVDDSKKQKLRDHAGERLPEFEVRVGGKTSIDVTKPGIDKAYGIGKLIDALGVEIDDLLFVGDRLEEGGNDYPVKAMGVESIAVEGFRGTPEVIRKILGTRK
jgi:HAD superfamily hydrolase (TIGR01484 family)